MTAALVVRGAAPQLATGDFRGFHERAGAALHPLGLQLLLLYRDLDGRQLVNTRVPWGTSCRAGRCARWTTLKPYYSDVMVGAVAQRPVVTLTAAFAQLFAAY